MPKLPPESGGVRSRKRLPGTFSARAITACRLNGPMKFASDLVGILSGIVFGHDPVGFDRRAGIARIMNRDGDAVGGLCEGLLGIAVAERALAREIAAQAVMQHRRRRIERRDRVDHGRQRLVLDVDQVERVFRQIAVGGRHDGDGFAHIAHPVERDRPAFDRRLHPDHEARRELGNVGAADDGDHAWGGSGAREIDPHDASMGMRRAQHRGVERAGFLAEIVDESSAAGQERRIFNALDRLTAPPGAFRRHCRTVPPMRS